MSVQLDYNNIRSAIIQHNYSATQFANLKSHFRRAVNSNRRWTDISNMEQLIRLLEKRDCLHLGDITPFRDIAIQIAVPHVTRLISRYGSFQEEVVFLNSPRRDFSLNNEQVLPDIASSGHEQIQQLICERIGRKWQEFARGLKITEGSIDRLETLQDSNKRIREILRYSRQQCDDRYLEWLNSLKIALSRARREDLSLEIDRISARHDTKKCF